MTTQQLDALRLADELCEAIAEYPEPTALEAQAATELRTQHARITELEAQLSAIGAGGVSPLRNAAQETEATHLRELAAPSTDQVEEILRERDDADDFIDALLDEVLGPERPEWSSAYGRADALNDVRERMTALHKPAVDKAWDRFQSAMEAPQQPAPSPVPAGWKLVPVEPTEEMLKAADDGDDAYTLRCFGPGVQRVMQGPYDHYCAMLDAAPTAQADTQPAQQGVSYAALPESFLEIPDVQDESGINAYYSREVVLECIDAALASHGQAPATQQAGEMEVFGLQWPGEDRINLSTVFDTETEALEYMQNRCDTPGIRLVRFSSNAPTAQAAESVTEPAGVEEGDIDAVALARYKVVPAHESMIHRFAVVAGDGNQQLYLGREVECENMARKFAGAFLDGAFYQANIAPTPPAQAADSVQEDAARYRWLAASCRSTSEHWGGRWSIVVDGPAPKSHDSEDDFNAAVDAARKQGGAT